MIDRGSTVTKAEARAVLEEYGAAMIYLLKEGYTINTSLFKIALGIGGVFTDENDVFDPARHQINLNVSAGDRLGVQVGQLRDERAGVEQHGESFPRLPGVWRRRNAAALGRSAGVAS